MNRRRYLRAAVTGGALSLSGCAADGWDRLAGDHSPTAKTDPKTGGKSDGDARKIGLSGTEAADFVWAEQALWRDERVRENLFAFAGRHGLAAVIANADAGIGDIPALENAFATAARYGVEAWLNVGVLKSLAAPTFVGDTGKRRRHLDELAAVAASYAEFFPDGRIVCWQEAPVGGRWVESGAWNDQSVTNLKRFGPGIFAAQKRRVRRAAPEVDIGIFVHFPYLVDGKQPDVFRTLADGLRARGALPDFTFTDFYRGWYAKDVGPGPANRAVRSLVTNARNATDGRPVTYLGEAHTVNPNYTPSKQANWMDLRAALGAGAEGVGWYARTAYTPTKRGFDPFIPNIGPAAREGPHASTFTFARDRYQYAYAALRAKRRRDTEDCAVPDTFDLWLVGNDFSFYDHRLSMQTRTGEWTFVGDFDGYLDGTYPYDPDGRTVSIFRGLSCSRFERNGRLELAVETSTKSDGARLAAVLAMPASAETFLKERTAAERYDSHNLEPFGMGHRTVDETLVAGESRRIGLDLAEPTKSMEALVFPNHRAQRDRLGDLESKPDFSPGDTFDLWVRRDRTHDSIDPSALTLVGDDSERKLDDASTARSTAPGGTVFYGLDRTVLSHRDGSVSFELAGEARGAVRDAYAMAYAGIVAFRPASEAMKLLDADPAAARTFAIAFVGR